MTESVCLESFRHAKGVISSALKKKIEDILNEHTCFAEELNSRPKHVLNKAPFARKKKQFGVGKKHGEVVSDNLYIKDYSNIETRKSLHILDSRDDEERAILCHLNKLSVNNFDSIKKSIRFAVTIQNVAMIFRKLVERSTSDASQSKVYIDMIESLCASLSSEEKALAIKYLQDDIEDSMKNLHANIRFPKVDPKINYDDFCMVSKKKRDLIGRCETHTRLMNGTSNVHKEIGDYRDRMYKEHSNMLNAYLGDCARWGENDNFDKELIVETLLECLDIIVKNHTRLYREFMMSAEKSLMGRLPTARCGFKLERIMRRA